MCVYEVTTYVCAGGKVYRCVALLWASPMLSWKRVLACKINRKTIAKFRRCFQTETVSHPAEMRKATNTTEHTYSMCGTDICYVYVTCVQNDEANSMFALFCFAK